MGLIMKRFWMIGLLTVAALGAGVMVLLRPAPELGVAPVVADGAAPVVPEAPEMGDSAVEAVSEPEMVPLVTAEPVGREPEAVRVVEDPAPVPAPPPARPTMEERQRVLEKRYWTQKQKQFEQLRSQLAVERDPQKRQRLIEQLALYIRTDTPATIDWAMGLADKEEKRAALEAINQHALVGIGAHIEPDETGFPKIRKTTALSAVGGTGMVEPGDLIVGMEGADGAVVSFDGMPLSEVVQHLRGTVGTEVRLFVERLSRDGRSQPVSFDVPVTRSMIFVQPPQ